MPELPPQICSYILADKSCYAHGADKVYEMPGVWKKKLAEKSSYKRRVSRPRLLTTDYVQWRGAFLCFNVDCEPGLEFHGEVVGEDGDFLDELFDQRFIKLCYVGFLLGDEVLQLLDPVHGFFPVVAVKL